MGKLIVTIGVGDQQGQQFEDNGSTFTALPAALLHELGVMVEHTAEARLADGRTTPVQIGHATIRLEGRTFPTPVIFAQDNEPSLLGVVTRETALRAVDPVSQRLSPVIADRL